MARLMPSIDQGLQKLNTCDNFFPVTIYIYKMGCQPSTEQNHSQMSLSESTTEQFKINYRQFVRNDIGQVFQFYHFSKIVSRSSTSILRKVIHRVSKIQRVCKIVPIQRRQKIHAIKQVQNLRNLDHPNIAQIQQYFFDKTYLYIIMELIQGKRLSQFLVSNSNSSLDALIRIFQQLLSAVNYCHMKGIAHNLIHPENILVIQSGKQFFLKLIDFSVAGVIKSPKMQKVIFPKQYALFKDPDSSNITNEKNDVWSCAMVFLFMISGEKSFENFIIQKEHIIKQRFQCFDIQEKTIKNILDLFSKMLEPSVELRISIKQCLEHQFFQQFRETRPSSKHRKKQENFLSRLVHFKVQSQLQSVFWMYASLNLLSSIQKCEYITQFNNLDKNKDGKLDRNQIRQGLINTFGLNGEESDQYVQKVFSSIDKNKNQYLQYSEFVMATSLISRHISEGQLQKIFKQIDYNKDGMITRQEISCIVGGLEGAGALLKQKKSISMKQFKNLMFQIFQLSKEKPIKKQL